MIRVQEADFDLTQEMAKLCSHTKGVGAVVNFVGLVRDQNEDRRVEAMSLEHYPGMTERAIAQVVDEASARWRIEAVTVIHRVGHLELGEQIVLVAIASAHRADAFLACEFVMDFLKTQAPFWKKESTSQGQCWVAHCQSDEMALRRWQRLDASEESA